jgi:hypothetical protein
LEFLPEREVLLKDQKCGAYRVTSYFIARSIGGLPSRITMPAVFALVAYPIAFSFKAYASAQGFAAWLGLMAVLVLTSLSGEAVGVLIGTTCVQLNICVTVSTIVALGMTIFGGFYIKDLPFFIEPLQYLSILKYGYDAAAIFEFSYPDTVDCDGGQYIAVCFGQISISSGEVIEYLGVGNLSLLTNLMALVCIYFICRGGALLILVYTVKY